MSETYDLQKLDDALDKTVLVIEKGLRDIDRGFSPLKKLDVYKKADSKVVKEKEKELTLLLA